MNDSSITISVREAAQLLGVGVITAYRAIESGKLPCLRLGNRPVIRVPRAALEQWANEEALKNVQGVQG